MPYKIFALVGGLEFPKELEELEIFATFHEAKERAKEIVQEFVGSNAYESDLGRDILDILDDAEIILDLPTILTHETRPNRLPNLEIYISETIAPVNAIMLRKPDFDPMLIWQGFAEYAQWLLEKMTS